MAIASCCSDEPAWTGGEEFDVDIDRPREIGTREVGEVAGIVVDRLRQEVRRHATD